MPHRDEEYHRNLAVIVEATLDPDTPPDKLQMIMDLLREDEETPERDWSVILAVPGTRGHCRSDASVSERREL